MPQLCEVWCPSGHLKGSLEHRWHCVFFFVFVFFYIAPYHGCCWETFYIVAFLWFSGKSKSTQLLKFESCCSPSNVNQDMKSLSAANPSPLAPWKALDLRQFHVSDSGLTSVAANPFNKICPSTQQPFVGCGTCDFGHGQTQLQVGTRVLVPGSLDIDRWV